MTSEERHEARYRRRRAEREAKKMKYAKYDDFDWVFSYAHLYKSFRKCCRNVGWKSSTQRYRSLAPLYVYRTYKRLRKGTYRSKGFFEFDIVERGKKRHIRSVIIDERVVQRCLCDYCLTPLLSRHFIYDNGASLRDKGYHFARNRVTGFLRDHSRKHGKDGYALLFDFSKYFDNIDHELCKSILRKNVTDKRLIALTEHFIDMLGDKGLGLGSQVSQIFALAAADELDHFIKEVLGIRYYERYMDDGCLIHESKAYLQSCLNRIRRKCSTLGIALNEKKTVIVKLSRGFTWLKTKFHILGSGRILRKIVRESVAKMRGKLHSFRKMVDDGRMTIGDVYMSFQSWRAYARCFDAHRSIRLTTDCLLYLFPEIRGDSKWQQSKTKPCSRSSYRTVAAW